MNKVRGILKKRYLLALLTFFSLLTGLALVMLQPTLSFWQESKLPSSRVAPATHLLVVALDSRGDGDVGLPDTLILVDLDSGERLAIARDWSLSRIEPGVNVVQKHLGFEQCKPFCTIQGVYSFAGGQLTNSEGQVAGLEAIRAVVQEEYGAASVALMVFDLDWARSFLGNIGNLPIRVEQAVPVGGYQFEGKYQGIERYIPSGEQVLTGEEMFWFARARHGSSNQERMIRQERLISQLIQEKSVNELLNAAVLSQGTFQTDLDVLEILFRSWIYQPQ